MSSPEIMYCRASADHVRYHGHPVACAAAYAVQQVIKEEKLVDNCREMGAHLGQLCTRDSNLIRTLAISEEEGLSGVYVFLVRVDPLRLSPC